MIKKLLPILQWIPMYSRQTFSGDMVAGITVAIMIIPQSMAYALLAGLPPEIGLYASILPMILYALFGSSRYLAVGPVALVSLMTASVMGNIAASGSVAYQNGVLVIALISGCLLIIMSFARLGMLANLLSKPILKGFTSAAAIIIGLSQLKYFLGLDIPSKFDSFDKLQFTLMHWQEINLIALGIGTFSIIIMLASSGPLKVILSKTRISTVAINVVTKLGPLFAVVIFTSIVWFYGLSELFNIKIVGEIPNGLPSFTIPNIELDLIRELLPPTLLIVLVGTIESISVAKSLASKNREKVEPNKELLGLGMANIGASLTGAYPITGGLSRSIVNYNAGAETPFASIFTAMIVMLVVLFLTPLFYYLPLAVLSSIVIIAVTKLFDLKDLVSIWKYNKADAVSMVTTFLVVLLLGVELGILTGVVFSVLFFLWRSSQPHIAIVGKVGENEHYRNVLRYDTVTIPHVLAVRVDESLFFVNSGYIENFILAKIVEYPEIEHLLLICSAINFIDSSALDTLESLVEELKDAGVTLHMTEVKGPVMDKLNQTSFIKSLGEGCVYMSTHEAMSALERLTKKN